MKTSVSVLLRSALFCFVAISISANAQIKTNPENQKTGSVPSDNLPITFKIMENQKIRLNYV